MFVDFLPTTAGFYLYFVCLWGGLVAVSLLLLKSTADQRARGIVEGYIQLSRVRRVEHAKAAPMKIDQLKNVVFGQRK